MARKLKLSKVKAITPVPDGSAILVTVEAVIEKKPTDLEIAITSDLAPAVAIALLSTIAAERAQRDGMMPALEVLAAAVVASGSAEKVRMHLLFDKGAVLPVEVPTEAARALQKDLTATLDAGK